MLKAVIIDDSEVARQNLVEDLQQYCPEVSLVGQADGVLAGAKLIRKQKPTLVFLDIEMPDGTGFDLLEVLGDISFAVIFTTAHDHFAIQAIRFSAIDYLLKPIDPDELGEAVARAKQSQQTHPTHIDTLLRNIEDKKDLRLALHTLEKIHVVPVGSIVRCEASTNYTLFYLADKRQLLVTKTLKEYDTLLGEHKFLRVHQSHLVNATFIKEFVKGDGGYLVLADNTQVPVASRKRNLVIQQLSDL